MPVKIEDLKPIIHIRVTAPPDLAQEVSQAIANKLQSEQYEVIEASGPRPIYGDDLNVKWFVSVR